MSSMEWHIRVFIVMAAAIVLGPTIMHAADVGRVETRELRGESLTHSLIGTNPVRKLVVNVPVGYESSTERYPVIYYLPNPLAKFDEEFYHGPARELRPRHRRARDWQDNLCSSGYGDAARVLLVCELARDGKLGRLHGSRSGSVCGRSFQDSRKPRLTRNARRFHGRIRRDPVWHDAS